MKIKVQTIFHSVMNESLGRTGNATPIFPLAAEPVPNLFRDKRPCFNRMHTLRDAGLCFIAFFYRALQTYGLQIRRPNHDFGNACPANAGIKKISSILLFFFFAFVSFVVEKNQGNHKNLMKIKVQTFLSFRQE
ncbi:MAG: hypothetical protein LBR50_09250 [Tannerella sp.]|jgi:hypothetical protein|nr:hypothetical protein [Tannerella sp.]